MENNDKENYFNFYQNNFLTINIYISKFFDQHIVNEYILKLTLSPWF
jgi:hypothetical protein